MIFLAETLGLLYYETATLLNDQVRCGCGILIEHSLTLTQIQTSHQYTYTYCIICHYVLKA
jgi:hypothetical protein